jgi:DnaD/phage-associated family protein
MARPQKQGLDYFPHDTDASMDEKIEGIEALFGLEGYAVYFKLCERIYRTHDGELDISDAETRQKYARNMGISLKKFDAIVEAAVEKNLFDAELFQKTKRLSSNGIKKRSKNIYVKREQMAQKYRESKLNQGISDAETIQKLGVSAEFLAPKDKDKVKDKENIPPTPLPPPGAVFGLFEQNYQRLTDKTATLLNDAIAEYSEPWVIDALNEGIERNKRSWKYVEAILKRWQQDGRGNGKAGRIPEKYHTMEEIIGDVEPEESEVQG